MTVLAGCEVVNVGGVVCSQLHMLSRFTGVLVPSLPRIHYILPVASGHSDSSSEVDCSGSLMQCRLADCLIAGMDWTGRLTVNLSPDQGPALLPTPIYPFFCTSAHHLIENTAQFDEGLTVADFSKNGPHFFDWEDLHEQVQIVHKHCPASLHVH